MYKFFRIPFADDGTRVVIPDDAQEDQAVSYEEGYTDRYSLPLTNPNTKKVERTKMNGLFYAITQTLKEWQTKSVPDFITAEMNDGDPYPYAVGALVRYDDKIYVSLVEDNIAEITDPAAWTPFAPDTQGRVFTPAGSVTILNSDGIIEINKTIPEATTINVNPAALTPFKQFTIKDGGGNAGTYNITITPTTGTIDGAASYVMGINYESVTFYSNGTNLRII